MQIYRYCLPLASPLMPFYQREGIIFQTEHGLGEAAPLPGWSNETIQDVIHAITNGAYYPSLEFGLRCARIPFPKTFPSIPISALSTNPLEAKWAVSQGYRTIKLKLKDYCVKDALDFVSQVQIPGIHLRIDMNRRWSFSDASYFLSCLNPQQVEYIEEPTYEFDRLHQFDFPLALDETLREPENRWLHLPNINTFVLKPTLLGCRLDDLIELGLKLNKKLVFSSSFESAIGLLHIAHLQARFSPGTAAGIDTHRFFLSNFFPMVVKNGVLSDCLLPPPERKWLKRDVP